jgi:hypothetical protein
MYISAIALSTFMTAFVKSYPLLSFSVVYILTRPIRICDTEVSPTLHTATANSYLCFLALLANRFAVFISENRSTMDLEGGSCPGSDVVEPQKDI